MDLFVEGANYGGDKRPGRERSGVVRSGRVPAQNFATHIGTIASTTRASDSLSLFLSPSPTVYLSLRLSPSSRSSRLAVLLLLPPFARSLRFLLSSLAFAPFHQDVTLPSPSPLPHSLSLSPRDSFFLLPMPPSPS